MTSKRVKSGMLRPSLASLPLPLFSLVMEFAVYDYTQNLSPRARSRPGELLKDVAMVCKSWSLPVQQLMQQFHQETMEIHVKPGEMDNILSEVSARGAPVRDLRVRFGQEEEYCYGSPEYTSVTNETEEMEVDWDALVATMPGLKRLDMKLVPLESKHLPEILQAVGGHCWQLEVVVMPRKDEWKKVIKGERIETTVKALYGLLERCYVKGGRGGLKQLTVPTRNDEERYRSSSDFLDQVTRFCPNIEYLDGSESAFHEHEGARCEDKWLVSLATWEKWNKTCSSLREFHWAPVPFADPFFRVFGAYPKPQLKTLTIPDNLLWHWTEYLLARDEETTTAIKDCYGCRAKDVGAVFGGCPALTNLTIEIDLQKYSEAAAPNFKIDVFGDKFVESLVAHCPLLERFTIRNCSNFKVTAVTPVCTFTDTALLRLADLKCLQGLESNAAFMCTGNGIFEYMRLVLESNSCRGNWRMLDFRVGGQQNGFFGEPNFYSVVVALLRRLAEISENDLGAAASRQKFEVYLGNPYHSRLNKQWSAVYMREELRPLMERVQQMHPSLGVNASLIGQSGDSFSRMDLFTLSWRPRDSDRDMFWNSVDDESDSRYEDPGFRMPTGLMNLFNEQLGYNSENGESASDGDDDDVDD